MADGTLSCPYPRQSPPSHDGRNRLRRPERLRAGTPACPSYNPHLYILDYAPHEPLRVP